MRDGGGRGTRKHGKCIARGLEVCVNTARIPGGDDLLFVALAVHDRPALERQTRHQTHHRQLLTSRHVHGIAVARGAICLGRERQSSRGVRVTELHVSAIAAMVGIQQATILNDLHEIHDLPEEGNRTFFVGIDRQVDGLVLSSKGKGRGTEAANHARTGAVQGVVSDGRGVTVGGRE
jgi:hypothetical protein